MVILLRTDRKWRALSGTSRPSTRRRPRSSPSTSIVPLSGFSRVMRRRSMVVLPEPLGPMIATFCPAGMSRSTSLMTWTSPNAFDTARNRTIGVASDASWDSAADSASMAGGRSVLGDKATLQSLDEDRGRIAQKQEDESDDRQR